MANIKRGIQIIFYLQFCMLLGKGQVNSTTSGQFISNEKLFQCNHSSEDVFLPNIPDFYFDPINAASFSTGKIANLTAIAITGQFLFIIPSTFNCRGKIKAIQYCYKISRASGRVNLPIMNVLFTRAFEKSKDIFIIHSEDDNCVGRICCGTTVIPERKKSVYLSLIALDSHYGIDTTLSFNPPLTFTSNDDGYYMNQYFDKDMEYIETVPLVLLRFLLGPTDQNCTQATAKPVTVSITNNNGDDQSGMNATTNNGANERRSNGVAVAATVPTVLFIVLLLLLLTIVTILFVRRAKKRAKLSSQNPPGIGNSTSYDIATPVNQAYGSSSASTRQEIYTPDQYHNTSQSLNISPKKKGVSATAVHFTNTPLPFLPFQQAQGDFDTGYVIEDEEFYSAGNALYDEIPNFLNRAVHATQNSPAEPCTPAYQQNEINNCESKPNIATFPATSENSQELPHSLHKDSQGKIVTATEIDEAGDRAEDEAVEQEGTTGKGEGVMEENMAEEQEEVQRKQDEADIIIYN